MATDTLSAIMPDIYAALDVVSREATAMIGSVTIDANASRAALNQPVKVTIEGAIVGVDIVPAMIVPEPAAQTPTPATITITKSRAFPFQITGDNQRVYNAGGGWISARAGRIAQALRVAVNEVEADLTALHITMSRAYGLASAVPFASTLADSAQLLKMLTDNGAPRSDLKMVLGTTAAANVRTLGQLTKANEAGTTNTLRFGALLNIHGFEFGETGQLKTSVAGTAASATVNNAGYAVGATTLTLSAAGTGTVLAGDVLTFAGDTNQYVITTGDTDVSNGGTIVLAEPGLRVAMSAATKAITVIAATQRNMAFSKSAIILAARAVATPDEGDMAEDRQMITDPISGLPFEIAFYKGFKMNRYEINLAWGVKNIKPAHTMLLLGSV